MRWFEKGCALVFACLTSETELRTKQGGTCAGWEELCDTDVMV